MSDFTKCTRYTYFKGLHTYECRKCLWQVSSKKKHDAEAEALHYWRQYKADGEYSDIIGGASVLDILK